MSKGIVGSLFHRLLAVLVAAVCSVAGVEAAQHDGAHEHCIQCTLPASQRRKHVSTAIRATDDTAGSDGPRHSLGARPESSDKLDLLPASTGGYSSDSSVGARLEISERLPEPPVAKVSTTVFTLGPPRAPPAL